LVLVKPGNGMHYPCLWPMKMGSAYRA